MKLCECSAWLMEVGLYYSTSPNVGQAEYSKKSWNPSVGTLPRTYHGPSISCLAHSLGLTSCTSSPGSPAILLLSHSSWPSH